MNKKIFTLLASSLMLFFTAIMVNAQVPGFYGSDVQSLPLGMGKGAYHLKVTAFGDNFTETNQGPWVSTDNVLLALDQLGYLKLFNAQDMEKYQFLREALWCVDVEKPGPDPVYNFLNKAHQTFLSVDTGRWVRDLTYPGSVYTTLGEIPHQEVAPGVRDVFMGVQYVDWAFSGTYNTSLMKDLPIFLEIEGEPDYFMTFATPKIGSPWTIELVKVHRDDLKTSSPFYINNLLRFTLVKAAPRVLTEEDFNTTLWTDPAGTASQMFFVPDVAGTGNVNVLKQKLTASASPNNNLLLANNENYYLNFQIPDAQDRGNYVYVADGADHPENFYNDNNVRFPILRDTAQWRYHNPTDQFDFRLVYYPTEDSLVINVRGFEHITQTYGNMPTPGYALDLETYGLGDEGLFNWEIWDWLTIRTQDLQTALGHRVLTVAKETNINNTRINFGVQDCSYTDDRTTVPRNLYVIRDELGRYLIMPLQTGDFTPRWEYLKENEDPMKTPSYQWLVYPSNEKSDISPVFLFNREFDWVYIEFAQIYKSYHNFGGSWYFYGGSGPGYVINDANVYYSAAETADPFLNYNKKGLSWNIPEGWHGSFLKVQDDAAAAAKVTAKLSLTQEEMQKLHRTGKHIGYKYIDQDTLDWHTYAFNYLNVYSTDYYLGTKEDQARPDTTLYVEPRANYFRLVLPHNLEDYAEAYGIGWADNLLNHPATEDIAPLERYYYHFQQNDYWNFIFDHNFIVLDDNGRYGFSALATANTNGIEKSAFYLRFTYQPEGKPEFYSILDRGYKSTFEYMAKVLNLKIQPELKVYDQSHGGAMDLQADTISVLIMAVDQNIDHLYARAQVKTVGVAPISTFSVLHEVEPLYRRFNDVLADDGGVAGSDDPRVLKVYRTNNAFVDYIYENQHGRNAEQNCMNCADYDHALGNGINFAALENIFDHNVAMDRDLNHWPHNYAMYFDTAYVNRGTGPIKPQYLLVVGPQFGTKEGCIICGQEIKVMPWVYGRFLINAFDSARVGPYPNLAIRDAAYIWNSTWERLAFVPAIHVNDTLFILNGMEYATFKKLFFRYDEMGEEYLYYKALSDSSKKAKTKYDQLWAIGLGDNTHKDVVWSMRFFEKGNYEDFMLESESTDRDIHPIIAPMFGGWVKIQNNELVISRGSYWDAIKEAEKWNTEPTTDDPVANAQIDAAAVKVIGGEGSVAILNAAGKRVTISNVLGQTVAGAVLTSDNATIAAPKGILVVAVEGENAVKAVVK